MKIAAAQAFWDLDAGFLLKLWNAHPDFDAPPEKEDEVSLLCLMARHFLGQSDQEAMDIVKLRWKENDIQNWYTAEFLQLDEALQVLDVPDVRMVQEGQKAQGSINERWSEFKRNFRSKAESLREAEAAGKKAKPGCKAGAKKDRKPLDATIPRSQAKACLPPNASIWQSRKGRAWCVHVKPRPRISEPWGTDQGVALAIVYQRAWKKKQRLRDPFFNMGLLPVEVPSR